VLEEGAFRAARFSVSALLRELTGLTATGASSASGTDAGRSWPRAIG
jgi:hypothetical protein